MKSPLTRPFSVLTPAGKFASGAVSQVHLLFVFLLPLLTLLMGWTLSSARGQTFEAIFMGSTGYFPQALVEGDDGAFYGTTHSGGTSSRGNVFKVTPEGVLTTIFTFSGTNGMNPRAELVKGSDGAFYGTTYDGGASYAGTVFKITPQGVLTTLVSFSRSNGSFPEAGLVEGDDGAFYGTTYYGGMSDKGTVFKMTSQGVLTTLVSFNETNGSHPKGGLVKGDDGAFYGTTYYGGVNNEGTVFKITPSGELTTLVSFNGNNGSRPQAGLMKGSDGAFYGTTFLGGANLRGTVFKVTAAGELTTLVSFNGANGRNPSSALVEGDDGFFYGTTYYGGGKDVGTVFKMTPAGELTMLISFNGTNGSNPHARLVQGSDGAFYGVVSSGTVFKVTPSGTLTKLASFTGVHGNDPTAKLLEGSDGAFYGTAASAGPENLGTVFKVTRGGVMSTLAFFNGANGSTPHTELVEGSDGNFYGTTKEGGANNKGTVFKMTSTGTLTTLVSFNGTNGSAPLAGLVKGADGAFYGTTSEGGVDNLGTIFKTTPEGVLTTLVSFTGANGTRPEAGLVKGSDGVFYGTTFSGGTDNYGTVFKITSDGTLTTLVSFKEVDGSYPGAELVKGNDGAFYGTCQQGGGVSSGGTVFKVTPEGTLITLVRFVNTNGAFPKSGLAKGSDGTLYGTTILGGMHHAGTIFKVTPEGTLTTLHSFDGVDAGFPVGTPVFSSDGDLYGAAYQMAIWRIVVSSAPSVTTSASDGIRATAATLHASVNPNGATATVWFEYGTTTAYSSSTAAQNIGADGSSPVAVSQTPALLPHTTYHFRVVAQNGKGITYGENQSFATLNSLPVANADVVSGGYKEGLAIPVLANDSDADGDALTVVSFTQPAHGAVVRFERDRNVLIYVPEYGFSGVDTFTYTMRDGLSAPVPGSVKITVGARPAVTTELSRSTRTTVPGAGEAGRGVPDGAIWRNFGVPAINDAGQVAFVGTWKSPEGKASAIFVDERLVVKTGDSVPELGSATFKSFNDPVLNGAGGVAFLATISGSGVKKGNDTVLVTNAFSGELEVIARESDEAPEAGGATLGKFYSISLQGDSSTEAGLLFIASLASGSGRPKVTPVNDFGAWLRTPLMGSTLRKVVREGDPGFASGEKIKSFQLLQALSGSPAQGRGHYAADGVRFTATLSSKRQALVRFTSEGTLEAEEFTGDQVGEALPEAQWKSFGLPASERSGSVTAVRAVLQNGLGEVTDANATGIFLSPGEGEAYTPVIRVGDEAFGVDGAVFSGLKDPLVRGWDSGVAFLGTIKGVKGSGISSGNDTGIWWQTPQGWSLVAREGDPAAETPEGTRWKSFTSLALPDGETGPLFLATLQPKAGLVSGSNERGIWGVDSHGELRLLVREKEPVSNSNKTLKSFTALQAVSGSAGVSRSFNNAGQLAYRAYFSDGSQGVVKVKVP